MNETDFRSWLKHFDFLLWDILSVTISFWTAFAIRKRLYVGLAWESSYRGLYLACVAFYVIIAFFFRSYSNIVRRSYIAEVFEVLKQNVIFLACMFAYLVFTKQSAIFSRLFLGYFIILNLVLTCMIRFFWKKMVRNRLKTGDKLAHLLIVTSSAHVDACVRKLESLEYQSFQVSGIVLVDGDGSRASVNDVPVVANAESMMEYIRLNVVDQVLLQVDGFSQEMNNLLHQLIDMGVVVHINMEQFESLPHKTINQMGGLSVITASFQTASMFELVLKRAMDIAGALVGLLITGVAFLFVAPAIYISSPGPVFFAQERIGKNGRKFKIYKFRSMYMDAEERKKELMKQNEMQGLMFKMENDPRIIKGIGHFIRDTSIDELPQFWNILKGDMSLVGTRPPTVDEFEQYNYHHKIRLSFKPGLTGMWQVSGRSDITDFEEVVRLDEQYIANWSIWLDIRILFKTVQVVLQRKGSK